MLLLARHSDGMALWVTKNKALVDDVKQRCVVLLQDEIAPTDCVWTSKIVRSLPKHLSSVEVGGCLISTTTKSLFSVIDRSIGDGDCFFQQLDAEQGVPLLHDSQGGK